MMDEYRTGDYSSSSSSISSLKRDEESQSIKDILCYHSKIVGSILLLLIMAQVVCYYMIIDVSQREGELMINRINAVSAQAYNKDPLEAFYNVSNIDSLFIKAAEINKNIKELQLQKELSEKMDSTLKELQQRAKALEKLDNRLQQLQRIRGVNEETTIQYLDEESSEYRFLIPKTIWLFDQLKQGYFEKMNEVYRMNIQRVSNANGYEVRPINQYNYFNFISRTRNVALTKALAAIHQRITEGKDASLTQNVYEEIQRTLIMLLVLQANGGIMVSKYLAFVQNFDWLRLITKNIFINRNTPGILPRAFGFHNISRSSSRIQEKSRNKDNRFKFLVKYPGIMSYFLAAVKGSQFVHDVINEILELLLNPTEYIRNGEELRKNSKVEYLYFISHNKIYEEFFEVGTMMALLRKEAEMSKITDAEGLIGLDHYGLITMNANYGPEKMTFFFQNNQGHKILQHLTKFDIKEFQAEIGKVRYIARLPSYYELNDYVNNLTVIREVMHKNSYFHLHFYPDAKEEFVIDPPEVPRINQNAQPWTELPKILWIYWHTGVENSNIIYQLCADNMKRYGEKSGFKIQLVSDSNLQDYLGAEIIEKIDYAVTHQASVMKSKYIKYDLIRLALVAKYGGIYMDLSYILLEDLNWLVNLPRYPSNYIFNRYGDKPKAFMFFHPHYGSPFQWQVDPKVNSKIAWQLGYQNNFIAAEKDNQLINDWFNELLKAIQTPYEDLEKEFKRTQMHHDRWTTFNDIYLISMDVVKYVIGKKQKELEATKNKQYRDASDYYKIWSMNGYMGQQKFRSHTSYDTNNHDNLFLRVFSQQDAELMVGKTLHLTKLYNYPVKYLMANFISNYDHLNIQFHQESIFMKYIFNSSRHSMIASGKNYDEQKLIIKE